MITVVQYNVQLDTGGNPVKAANGRFIKTDIRGYTAMEKRTGWGSEYPENIRNGEWEYQTFTANKMPNATADLNACFNMPQEAGEDGLRVLLREPQDRDGEIARRTATAQSPPVVVSGRIGI